MNRVEASYLQSRLWRVFELIQDGNTHMASVKLLADISALKGISGPKKKYLTNYYRCNKCKKIYERKSEKLWINSYCQKTDQNARLYRIEP